MVLIVQALLPRLAKLAMMPIEDKGYLAHFLAQNALR